MWDGESSFGVSWSSTELLPHLEPWSGLPAALWALPSAKDFVAFIRFEGDPWIFEACVESQTGLGWEGP